MDLRDFDELESRARKHLSPGAAASLDAGADDSISVRENVAAWRALRFRPHVLVDVREIDISTTLLGQKVEMPVLVAPMGRHKNFHPEGEAATARGAAMANAIFTLPTYSTTAFADIARERKTAPQWFHLYMPADKTISEHLIDGAVEHGFKAIVFTVDQPVGGYNPESARNPVPISEDIRLLNWPGQPVATGAYHASRQGFVNFPTTWVDLDWLVKRSVLPVIVKGTLRGDEARRCIDAGAKAVIVSNHGGRHLDTTVTTAEALPEVVAAVAGRGEVYVDSGVRRGSDILKAFALGARAVLIGRPVIWGLAVDGANGVRDVLLHLTSDLKRVMMLAGVPRLGDATPDLIAPSRAPHV
jgi:4-hydroxymandelate oxidase